MGIKPFSITRKRQPADLINDVADRLVDIEHDFIVEAAKFLQMDGLAELYARDRWGALSKLREAFQKVESRHWDAAAKTELNLNYNAFIESSLNADERIYKAALERGLLERAAAPLPGSDRLKALIAKGYQKTWDVIDRIQMTGTQEALATLDEALGSVATGSLSIDQAIRGVMDDFAEKGVTGHVYPSGRKISMSPYVRRELQTNMMNLTRECGFERANDWGADLIQVSAHAGARKGCFPYQGRVFSLSGGDARRMALSDTSYGEPAGLFGINCRHYCWPFFEGLNDEYTADQKNPARLLGGPTNAEIYDATQVQRYNERQIRKWKRKKDELEALGANPGRAERKIKEWQAAQRAHIDASQGESIDLRRDYLREKA